MRGSTNAVINVNNAEPIIAHRMGKDFFRTTQSIHFNVVSVAKNKSKRDRDSGIEQRAFDTNKMTIAYYDMDGNETLIEKIE